MGWKYNILFKNLDDKAWNNFGSEYLILAMFKLISVFGKYSIINFEIRRVNNEK